MKTKLSFLGIVGLILTGALLAASLSPTTFHIPTVMRPWIFMVNVVWFISFCSGILNQ